MVGRKKIYLGIMIYTILMAALFISRITNFNVLWSFLITSVIMGSSCFFLRCEGNTEKTEVKGRQITVFSSLIFSAWFLVALPLVLMGDYITSKVSLGYDISFLSNSLDSVLLWVCVGVSSIAYERFFRGAIFELFAEIRGNKIGAIMSSLCFSAFFLDIRLFLAAFFLNLALLNIRRMSKKIGYLFSFLSSAALVFVMTVISGENSGGETVGILNILGMLLIFTSIGASILYFAKKNLEKEKPTLIEVCVITLLVFVMFLVGILLMTV